MTTTTSSVSLRSIRSMTTTTPPMSLTTSHKSLISVVVILVVLMIGYEIAGVSSTAADWVLIVLVGAVLIRGMTLGGSFQSFSNKYPWIP